MKSNFKTKLLLGAAVTALSFGAAGAQAADLEVAGTIAAPGVLAPVAVDNVVNAVNTNAPAGDASHINTSGGLTATNINLDHNTTLGIYNDGGAAADAIVFSGFADVASGTTFTIVGGGSEADGTGTNGDATSVLTINGNLGEGSATNNFQRGGTLSLVGIVGAVAGQDTTVNVNGNTLLTAVNATGGAGGAAAGAAVGARFGDAATDTFNVNTLNVTGGAGSGAANFAGGSATVTVNGVATVNGATVVRGGASGNGGAAANGGGAALTFNNGVSSSSTLLVAAGADAGPAGVAGSATFTTRGNTTFTTITLDDTSATETATFVADVAGAATTGFTVNGTINGATAGEGALVVTDSGAANTTDERVTFTGNIGTTRLRSVTVGSATQSGHAVFNGTVAAATITVGNNAFDDNYTADFNGNVSADTINVVAENAGVANANATLVTFAGNVTVTDAVNGLRFADAGALNDEKAIVTFDGPSTSTQTFTGNITTANDGEGIINVGTATSKTHVIFTGTIGAVANAIEQFNVAQGAVASIRNDLFAQEGAATDSAINIDGKLNISSAANAVTVRAEAGDVDVDGVVDISGRNAVTISSASDVRIDGVFDTDLVNNAVLTLTGADDIVFADVADTKITSSNRIVLTGGEAIFGDITGRTTTVLAKKVDGGYNPSTAATALIDGTALATGLQFDTRAQTVFSIAKTSAEFDNGDVIWFVNDDQQVRDQNGVTTYATLIQNRDIVLQDTAFAHLTHNTAAAVDFDALQDLKATVNLKKGSEVLTGNARVAVGAVDALLGTSSASTSGQLEQVRGNLIGATGQNAQDIAESLAPNVDGGVLVGATSFVNNTSKITSTQLASLRDGNETGMFAGNVTNGVRAWAQAFGALGDQDDRDGVAGFDYDTAGVALGLDTQGIADNWIFGLGFAYSETEVDSKGVNRTNTDIDSYQVSLYTSYDLDDRTYIAGQVGYVWGDNDQTRTNIGGAGLVADSSFDTDTIFFGLEAGRKYTVGGNTTLTPKALVNYQHFEVDGYRETGSVGNAGLIVNGDDLDLFEIGVGVDAAWDYQLASGAYLQPQIGVGVRHDLVGDEYATSARFIGAGNSFKTEGFDPAQTTFNVSADLTYFSTTNWELSAGYDFEYKSDFDSHAGTLRAAYKF